MNNPADPGSSPIFIVGAGRSGTTLLRLMLCAHPNIYISHETSIYVWDSLFNRKADGTAFLHYFFETFSFRWLQIHPADVLNNLPNSLAREGIGEAFRVIMRIHAERYGRSRFGDKTPAHAAHLGRIFVDFPEARVLHITRDPRGVVLSSSRVPWASQSDHANAVMWNTAQKSVDRFSDRVLDVRLEDLLADGRAEMERVLEFVGEPWDEAVLDHARHVPAGDSMPALPWLTTAARPRGEPTTRWQDMMPVRVRAIELMCRQWMKAKGYPPAQLEAEPGRFRVWRRALSGLPESLRFFWVYARLGFHQREAHRLEDKESKILFSRLNPLFWDTHPGFELPEPPPLPTAPRT